MALSKRALFLATMVIFFLCGQCDCVVHKVGDSNGWTTMGGVDYGKWASNRTFMVGDTLVFEYNKQFHNVIQVTHQDFRSCNATSPIAAYTSGRDSIAIERTGHLYFLCGIPGHCLQGQKVDIRVPRPSLAPNPSPIPSPTASPSGPIKSDSALPHCSKLWLVLSLLAAVLCWI